MHSDPVGLTCKGCGKEIVFFDSGRDGYDGRLGHGTTYFQSEERSSVACANGHSEPFSITAQTIYNIDLDEIEDIVREHGGNPSDYFDAFGISALCQICGEDICVGDWECA
ncbi:MAG: hypothetical protein H7X93_02930 [Sphingomonadaceae bacterium]|nr:hypothetical protein [Sphingomonadaceae bacterium]